MRLDVPITDAEEAAAWIRKNLVMKCEKQDDGKYILKCGRGKPSFISPETVVSYANSIRTPGFVPVASPKTMEKESRDDKEFAAEIWEVRGKGWAVCGFHWGKFAWGQAFDDFGDAAYRLQRWCQFGEAGRI